MTSRMQWLVGAVEPEIRARLSGGIVGPMAGLRATGDGRPVRGPARGRAERHPIAAVRGRALAALAKLATVLEIDPQLWLSPPPKPRAPKSRGPESPEGCAGG